MSLSVIYPYLYLSGSKVKNLNKHGITHAVDASNMFVTKKSPHVKYLHVRVDDLEENDIKSYFAETGKFINAAKVSTRRLQE